MREAWRATTPVEGRAHHAVPVYRRAAGAFIAPALLAALVSAVSPVRLAKPKALLSRSEWQTNVA